MSQVTDLEVVEKAHLLWFGNKASSQKSLARELGISHSIVHNVANGKHKFSEILHEKFPNLKRSLASGRAVKPVSPVRSGAVTNIEVEETPELELAMETIEALPSIKPQVAVVLAKTAFGELSELLELVNRPCPRLAKYLGNPKGRPPMKNQKAEEAVKQTEDMDLLDGEQKSEEFLRERVK
jgi:hypothetical protein